MGDRIMNRWRRSIHDFLIDDDDHALNHESVELKFEENRLAGRLEKGKMEK